MHDHKRKATKRVDECCCELARQFVRIHIQFSVALPFMTMILEEQGVCVSLMLRIRRSADVGTEYCMSRSEVIKKVCKPRIEGRKKRAGTIFVDLWFCQTPLVCAMGRQASKQTSACLKGCESAQTMSNIHQQTTLLSARYKLPYRMRQFF